MDRRNITWILVADGARARIFVNDGTGKEVTELPDRAFTGSRRRSRDLGADRPGRTFDSVGAGRHAKAPPTDPHRYAESEFLRSVMEWLVDQEHSGRFDHLVMIAAPQALGDLRKFLPKALARKVVREIARDLTRADAARIEACLSNPDADWGQ
jgi:protein required for attachment to host cells